MELTTTDIMLNLKRYLFFKVFQPTRPLETIVQPTEVEPSKPVAYYFADKYAH